MAISFVSDATVHSRAVQGRLEHLQHLNQGGKLEPSQEEDLRALKVFASEVRARVGETSWREGVLLMSEETFLRQAREDFEKSLPPDTLLQWPYAHISWSEAADALMDTHHAFFLGSQPFFLPRG